MEKIKYLIIDNGAFKMRRIIFLLFLTLSSLFAQDPNWTSFITFPQYPSPYFTDWERNPNIGTLNINYMGTAPVEFYFEVIINIDGYGEAIRGRTANREYLSGPVSEMLTFNDISDWQSTTINKELETLIIQSGKLPESNYTICVSTFATNGNLLTDACTDFEIALPNPPQLISPEEEGSIEIDQPTFMWNPVSTPSDILVYYHVKIVEILQGQTAFRAIEANVPIVETEVPYENLYIYRLDDYPLEPNHSYAWQIQATNDEGAPVATNEGYSEIWKFTYGNSKGGTTADTLMLIENLAYLIDVKDLNIADNNTFLNLDGSCRMLLKAADGTDKFVDVFTQNLMLQKDEEGYKNPIFLGGNILGTIYDQVFGDEITGKFFKPTELEFIPPNQITIGGDFYLSEDVDIPLTGKLTYIDGELSGDLSLIGTPESPIFSIGDESFKMNLSSVALSYPSIETNLEGTLSIFGTPSNCNVTDINLSEDGSYDASISCDINQEIALLQGSTLFNLNVNSIEGKISGNLLTNKIDYSVVVDGGLLFSTLENNQVSAEIIFKLEPNNFKLISFIPSADVNASTLDLGWLKWNMQNMKLNNLEYQNGNWDFDLSMDMDLSFPDFTDDKFPTLRGITFTPKGFEFPKIDFDNFSIPNIDFGGFGLEISGLRSQAYTFDLSKWTPGSIANFSFDFDAKFTMPNLPEGTASDLLSQIIKISPKFTNGNFSVNIPEIKLRNPLSMPILNGIKFNVQNILGSIGSNYDGSLFSYLPNIKFKGELELPEGLSCNGDESAVMPIETEIAVSGNGRLSGLVKNIVPNCPIKFGVASLYFSESQVEFVNKESQKIILSGTTAIKFTDDENAKPIGKLKVEYDILNNDLISLNGEINSDFRWDIIPQNPILSFNIGSARVENNILIIDGRNKLTFNGNTEIGATFDQLNIDLNNFEIQKGKVFFDTGFNLKIAGIDEGELAITSHPSGTKLNGEEGLMLSFPDRIGFGVNGFTVTGDGSAEIVFNGQEYSDLSVKFTEDFAFNPKDFSVKDGRADFFFKDSRLAYWNNEGLFPDMSFFMNYVIPDRIPLPTLEVAYLQVRRNDSLLVNITPDGDEIVIETLEGQPIPLVMPGLQFSKPLPPQMNVDFNITFNTNREEVTSGSIFVQIPEEHRAAFDLSQIGIPYQVHSLFYGEINGDYGFRLTGKPKLFETEFTCSDSTSLFISRAGSLIGHISCDLETVIPMVPNSDKLNLKLNTISGDFDIDLVANAIDFDFELDSDIRFQLNDTDDWGVWTLLGVTPRGIEFRDSRVDSIAIGKISLPNFDLGISNLSLPNLSYTNGPNGGWNFEFGMDIDLDFPQFDFSVKMPSSDGMSFTKTGFHFPDISLSELPDSLKFELGGFELFPIAFRLPSFDFNWFSPLSSEIDWNFKFDFIINFPNVDGATGNMLTPNLAIRDVAFTNGLFIGEFPTINFEPGTMGLNYGNGLGFDVTGINGNFFDDNGSQGIDFGFKGKLKMPQFASCQNEDGTTYDISDTEFRFSSKGLLSGRIESFAPTCPLDIGIGKFNVTASSLDFLIAEDEQKVVMDMTGNLKFPIGGSDSVTANGAIALNLLTGKMIDGFVEVNEPFVWAIPNDKPVLRFNVNSARIDTSGFKISGNSRLLLPDDRFEEIEFEDFVFDIERYKVKSGRVAISSNIGLKLLLTDNGLDWKVIGKDDPLTENRSAKIGISGELVLDKNGLAFSGESIASIHWDEDIAHQFDSLRIVYTNNFNMRLNPFEVSEGKAELFHGDNLIASVDHGGFHLGEGIFGEIPIPAIIPLPDSTIAYLRIKDALTNELLINTENVDGGTHITTREGSPLKLVFPSLRGNEPGATDPAFDVVLHDVVYNFPSTFVSGYIEVTGEDGASIINLTNNGIPVELLSVRYGDVDGTNKLTANARMSLPGALSEFPINLENLEFDENGIAGNINIGEYFVAYPQNEITTMAFSNVGDNAIITLEGIETEFGDNKSFKFSGKFIPKIFVDGEDTSKIHYSAEWDSRGNQFKFNLDLPEGASINLGIAQFMPTQFGELPAMQLGFTSAPENDFALVLNGQILIDEFGNGFNLDFKNLRLTKSTFSVDDIHLEEPSAIEFDLFNSPFRIYDVSPSGSAIQFSYNDNVLKISLSGDFEFFGKTIEFENFRIGTDGSFDFPAVNFLGTPLVIVDNFLTLTEIKITDNRLSISGWGKLPEPASAQSKFNFGFGIGADGTVYATADNEIVLINDPNRGKGNDDTEYEFWVGDFDPTYLSLLLNFEDIQASKIRMVADVYLGNNQIGIGSKGLNTLEPGFEIDFRGRTTWGTVDLPESWNDFEWEMLKMGIEDITINEGSGLNFEMTGNFGLDFDGVGGGGINFGGTERGGLRISSSGGIANFANSISGGEIVIVDLIEISVENVDFSTTPTNIDITSNTTRGNNASAGSRTINVKSFFRFGGSIDIAGIVRGGVDNFLSYTDTDGNYGLLIENAHLEIDKVLDVRMDLIYENGTDGFRFLAGGNGQLNNSYEVTVVGKIASGSFGFFLAVDNLNIQAGPVTIEGLGGGFFYNPTASDISNVKSMAGLNNPTVDGKIKLPDNASFAVFLYGALSFIDDGLIEGRVLLTLAGSIFTLDGEVVILTMDEQLYGLVNLQADFANGYFDGNIHVYLHIWELLEGNGELAFYVYGRQTWGIIGDVDVEVLNFFDIGSHFFVGPSGFLVGFNATTGFDIWIIEVNAGFEAQVWYIKDISWGAYAEAYVSAELWAGIASAKGTLKCALFGEPDFYIYGEAGVSVSVLCFSGSATVWAKISADGVDGDKGHDSEMRRLIDEARGVSAEAEAQAVAIQDAIENQPPPAPESIVFSSEELAVAFNSLSEWGRKYKYGTQAEKYEAQQFLYSVRNAEYYIDGVAIYNPSLAESNIYRYILDEVYKGTNAPMLTNYESGMSSLDSILSVYGSVRSNYTSNFDGTMAEIESVSYDIDSVNSSPLDLANFREPEFETYIDEETGEERRRIIAGTQPSFNVDEAIAEENENKLTDAMARANAYEEHVLAQMDKIDQNIEKIEAVLVGPEGNAGAEELAYEYTSVIGKIGKVYTEKFVYDKRLYYWAESINEQVQSKVSLVLSEMERKATNIYDRWGWQALRNLHSNRANQMAILSGDDSGNIITEIENSWNNYHASANEATFRSWAIRENTSLGNQLWYSIPAQGLARLRNASSDVVMEDKDQKNSTIDNLRSFQADFTVRMDDLYSSLAEMYELKYDILNQYIYWKRSKGVNANSYIEEKNRINRKMRMPNISTLNVLNVDFGLYSMSVLHWQASGSNSSESKYLIDYSQTRTDIMKQGLQAVGSRKYLNLYHLPTIGQTLFGNVNFIVNARTPIGYKINRQLNFRPRFSNRSDVSFVEYSVSESETDYTPPIVSPTLQFPEEYIGQDVEDESGMSRKYYIGNPNLISASWEASDEESGIHEYLYKLVEVENPDKISSSSNSGDVFQVNRNVSQISYQNISAYRDLNFVPSLIVGTDYSIQCQPVDVVRTVLPATTNNGRSNVLLNTINLTDKKAYKLIASAVNGDGISANNCGGMKQYLIVDTTPPTKPIKHRLGSRVLPSAMGGHSAVNPTVEAPSYRGHKSFNYSFTYGINDNSDIDQFIVWGNSEDSESGLLRYEFKVTNKRDESITTNWLSNGLSNRIHLTNSIDGVSILNYVDSFYVDIRAINMAQLPSESIRYTFRPYDPTVPSDVDVAAAYSNAGTRARLVFNSHSVDAESGIDYYEVAVGFRTDGKFNYVKWDDGIRINPEGISIFNGTYLLPTLPRNTKSYIAVRAVNNQGAKGRYCYTGPFYYDETRPITPKIRIVKENSSQITLHFTDVRDLESEIVKTEYRILKQSIGDRRWSVARNWSESYLISRNTVRLSDINTNLSHKIKVYARTINSVGLVSVTGVSEFVLDTTPPITPDVNVMFSSSIKDHSSNLSLSFIADDPETGISKIEYKIAKEIRMPNGFSYNGTPRFIVYYPPTIWRDNGTDLTKQFKYSDLGLNSGDKIRINVRTTNRRGVLSQISVKDISLP